MRIPILVVVLAGCTLGCGPGVRVAEDAVEDYVRAVQLEDTDSLSCLSAGATDATPDAFSAWFVGELEHYRDGRDAGFVDVHASAVVLTKAFTLGKGTFYRMTTTRSVGEDIAEADMAVRFAYGDIDVSGLPPGAGFYVAGTPIGTIHWIRIPRRPTLERHEVLDTVTVRWTLVREADERCGDRWTVHAADPLEDSASTLTVSWEW